MHVLGGGIQAALVGEHELENPGPLTEELQAGKVLGVAGKIDGRHQFFPMESGTA